MYKLNKWFCLLPLTITRVNVDGWITDALITAEVSTLDRATELEID
ncbi:hypothetical protein [Clostridium sp. Marseille-Q2269]|nr:hypothetical protein [Clostridium sp. Marseille-Q2269]